MNENGISTRPFIILEYCPLGNGIIAVHKDDWRRDTESTNQKKEREKKSNDNNNIKQKQKWTQFVQKGKNQSNHPRKMRKKNEKKRDKIVKTRTLTNKLGT